jgi:hypothetical protein
MTISFERKSDFVERRRQGRASIGMTIALRERGRSALDARLIDLSALGCQIDGLIVSANNAQVWVKLPGLESLAAQQVWSSGSVAGLCFDTPLHPAVAARFLPAPGSHAAAAIDSLFDASEPLLSRREQIMAGIAQTEQSPLQRRKKPSGLGMFGRINRVVSRSVDHRAERRYADAIPEGTTLAIRGERVHVLNVSPSGLKVRGLQCESEIGDQVDLSFEGFPEMTGQLVWMNGPDGGIALPPASIELFDRSLD